MKRTLIWIGALVVGAVLGVLGLDWLNEVMNFVATVYTRLFQLLAVPTIVLAVITTFATFGSKGSGRIFGHTLSYTLLTTIAAASVGALLYVVIAPGNLPVLPTAEAEETAVGTVTYYDHLISIIPNNIVKPFFDGNVLSLLLLAFSIGIGLSKLPELAHRGSACGHRGFCGSTVGAGIGRRGGRLYRQVRIGGAGRQCASVLCGAATIPGVTRT